MRALAWIGEQRIAQAVDRGELDGLPGQGQPLDLFEPDAALPPEWRLALKLAQRQRSDTAAAERRERERLRMLWRAALLRRGRP